MYGNCRNYYKESRDLSGYTQEQAAEQLGIGVRTLSSYENWDSIPSDEVVEKMVKLYKVRELGWWHLRNTSSLAKKYLPEIKIPKSNSDVYMQIDFSENNISHLNKKIKKILSDEKITADELEKFQAIQEKAKITAGKLMAIYTYEPRLDT